MTKRHFNKLEARLLAIGGDRVVRQEPAPYLAEILDRGELFDLRVRRRRGKANRCHANAADIWARGTERYRLAHGFGLSEDGLWRMHSWALDDKGIIETTEARERYFGFVLDPYEALYFWEHEYLRYYYHGPMKLSRQLADADASRSG
jgi:hypothetical protein